MDETQSLIAEIEGYCRRTGLAESTFSRLSVNDGKFVGRVRAGGRVTTRTVERIRAFIEENPSGRRATRGEGPVLGGAIPVEGLPPPPSPVSEPSAFALPRRDFRFYDNRQKYLLFVNTCSEKWVIAERVGMELGNVNPRPPALRVFDAGMGDGTVLTRVMRHMHRRFPNVPFYKDCQDFRVRAGIMGKEETPYVPTQRACDTERSARSVAGWRSRQRGF